MNLKDLQVGHYCRVLKTGGEGELRQHFLDMGIIPEAELKLVKYAPMGDPMELMVHGYELTLRLSDAEHITVEEIDSFTDRRGNGDIKRLSKSSYHPGLGESGIFHEKATENPLPKNEKITFALVGNQNCGKTSLFNQLTGSNQHVGNFPGVTVDRKDGVIRGCDNTLVTDLPGIYSMSPYTQEEIVTRAFVLNEKPKGIINIVDATNIERNLYLTMQLLELEIPMVLALNMMDEVRDNGGSIRINEMEELLGIPVVPISAAKNEGINELIAHAMHVATYQEKPMRLDYCDETEHEGTVHRALHGVMHLIEDHAKTAGIPVRFAASKVIEGDTEILKALKLDKNECEMLEHIVLQMEEERELDRAATIADMRFDFIMKVCDETVIKPRESKEHHRSMKIDRVLTGKYTAVPAFLLIMGLCFYLTFGVLGAYLQELLETFVDWASLSAGKLLTGAGVSDWLRSLIVEGIIGGVGSVLSFLPVIVILFFFLSLLEDTGYLARVAFVMDKPLRKISLSGRSIVPMLVGFGCSVPGIMASRTLPSVRDRKLTILLTPFMSCSAKLPIYAFFSAAFFPKYSWLVMIGLYIFDIIIGIIMSFVYRKTFFKGSPVPFVMELPNYRLPTAKNVFKLLWEKAKDFLQRAFTVIFIASVVIWFLQHFDIRLNMVTDTEQGILAEIAGIISPVFRPLGFGDWRITTSLVSGFMAKESVVSTLNVLIGNTESIHTLLNPATAISLLVFSSLYTPCIAAIAAVKRELGKKYALYVCFSQCIIAWIVTFIVYNAALLIVH